MDIGPWLNRIFPEIKPDPRPDGSSWVALIKTRTPEHNPPLFWLGKAIDVIEEYGQYDLFENRARTALVSPNQTTWESEQRIEDIFSEACAFAWAARNLGEPKFIVNPSGSICISVPEHEVLVAHRRIHPQRNLETLITSVTQLTTEADEELPKTSRRLIYVDIYLNLHFYAQDVGYRLELTEPMITALRDLADQRLLDHVLTRPFQWGKPLHASY